MKQTGLKNAEEAPRRETLDRRQLLKGAAAGTILVMSGALISPSEAWGLEVVVLQPETMRTLVLMARDIFPHDRFADRYYAIACKAYDDEAMKDLVEGGIAALDAMAQARHGTPYAGVGWEADRAALLRQFEGSPLFAKVRGDLVVSLYNQQEVWAILGYEGESASKGGYIDRGFDDIDWL